MKRSLVMTLGVGYEPEAIEPFFVSLRKSGYAGDVAYFTHRLSARTQAFLDAQRAQIVPFTPPLYNGKRYYLYTQLTKIANLFVKEKSELWRTSQLWMNLMNARFVAFAQHWENVSALYDEVLITDLRDVIFQSNPFDCDYGCEVGFFSEDDGRRIKDCARNSLWLKRAYGEKGLREIGERPVLCAGVVYLRASQAGNYLRTMVEAMRRTGLKTAVDQGVHNYLGHRGVLPGSRIFSQRDTPVMNIGTMKIERVPRDREGFITDFGGRRAAIVHQYDRFETLKRELPALLCR